MEGIQVPEGYLSRGFGGIYDRMNLVHVAWGGILLTEKFLLTQRIYLLPIKMF